MEDLTNGFIIYGIDQELLSFKMKGRNNGFIDNNEIWCETDEPKQYIYFGDAYISNTISDKFSDYVKYLM